MKKLIIALLLVVSQLSFSQSEKITLKKDSFKSGQENTFIYQPSNENGKTKKMLANYVYIGAQKKSTPLVQKENHFEFSLKVPDSIKVLIISINSSDNKVLDNNAGEGHTIYLKNKSKKERRLSKLEYLTTFQYANFYLKTKIDLKDIISQYEKLFKESKKLKTTDSYSRYLFLKYNIDKEKTKPELIEFAEKLAKEKKEKDLMAAVQIYSRLKLKDKNEQLSKIVLKKFPYGQLAKRNYLNKFYGHKNKTAKFVLEALAEYSKNFKDDSQKTKDRFYTTLVAVYLKQKDLENILKYEKLVSEKMRLAANYNNSAWKLSGEDLTSPGESIDFAEKLSKKSLDIVLQNMDKTSDKASLKRLKGNYSMYSDTYALLLFKQKKYDLAFEYQDKMLQEGRLGLGEKERYAAFAEKAKGSKFAQHFLEKELLAGTNSTTMLKQLDGIYKTLNLPKEKYEEIKKTATTLANKIRDEKLIKTFGSIKGIDFDLTNLKGDKVKLSDYKGKIVVLDFWATWCGPCKASFPKMQELVTKYKDDNVEFLFINVWERDKPENINKKVTEFIDKEKYSFNVLYDYKNEVVKQYKVRGIPTKIIIDKKGNIVSNKSSYENLIAVIEESLN